MFTPLIGERERAKKPLINQHKKKISAFTDKQEHFTTETQSARRNTLKSLYGASLERPISKLFVPSSEAPYSAPPPSGPLTCVSAFEEGKESEQSRKTISDRIYRINMIERVFTLLLFKQPILKILLILSDSLFSLERSAPPPAVSLSRTSRP
jgi:hypothetical protein